MSGTGKPKEYTVEDYLESLFEAIENVGDCYIHDYYHKDGKRVNFTHVERIFTYEVYHQWRLLLDKKNESQGESTTEEPKQSNTSIDEEVRIDAEIFKDFVNKNKSKRSYHRFYPDMVLHGGQGDSENNFIVCEFKRMYNISNKLIIDDLKKLDLYVDQNTGAGVSHWTPFRYGVFVLIFNNNAGRQCVQEELYKLFSGSIRGKIKTIKNQDKIICYISDGENFHHDFLCNLINED